MATTTRDSDQSEFGGIWIPFTESARPFLVPVADDRTLDQFLSVRDKVYTLVQDPRFVRDLDRALQVQVPRRRQSLDSAPPDLEAQLREVFLEKMRACTRAGEVLQATDATLSTSEEGRKKSKAQLSKLSTTLGSLKDVLGEVPYLKTGVGLFKELIDYFK